MCFPLKDRRCPLTITAVDQETHVLRRPNQLKTSQSGFLKVHLNQGINRAKCATQPTRIHTYLDIFP